MLSDSSARDARRRHSTRETSGRLDKFTPQISCDERGISNKTYKKKNLQAKQKNWSHHDMYAMPHARRLLDKPQIKSPDRASDTVPSDERTSASNNNKNYHSDSNPKIKRILIVWCSGLAIATSSWVQSTRNNLDGFSQRGLLDSELDLQILLRRLLTSSLVPVSDFDHWRSVLVET
jgi:hypothetical protein